MFFNPGYSADELNLEPISGEIKAGSHVVIKMTLNSARIATSFEGEIECLIEWGGDTSRFKELEMLEKQRIQSRQSVNLPNTESLFLRIKKTSVLVNPSKEFLSICLEKRYCRL